ncbi:DUF2637 domain-containing protein [Micromonospora fluostatini]|uniref:DUF2637 domain-containing protein n=1 Tax=Micromonospora sp. JCM 30529 TaxID=3421643 RepID=UPI003D183F8D
MSRPTGPVIPAGRLRRLRWAVRATLTLGITASIAANILHAQPNPISQIIAAWPPLALWLTVELISRVPTHRRYLHYTRLAATAVISGIAAWVSYWHMVGVAARYGETQAAAAYLLPISVDGLVIVASISLVDLTARVRAAAPTTGGAEPAAPPESAPTHRPAPAPARPSPPVRPVRQPDPPAPPAPATTANTDTAPDSSRDNDPHTTSPPGEDARGAADRRSTAEAVRWWHQRDPALHPAQIADRIGRSERTVRRYWPPTSTPATSPCPPRRATDERNLAPTPRGGGHPASVAESTSEVT